MKMFLILANSWPKKFKQVVILVATLTAILMPNSLMKNVEAQTNQNRSALTVRSDVQEANSETGIITARGNVYINYPARDIQATATQAQYFSNERRLVLSGNVYVLQEGNTMRAETMTYLIDEGRFIATPESDQQVESIYLVEDQEVQGGNNN